MGTNSNLSGLGFHGQRLATVEAKFSGLEPRKTRATHVTPDGFEAPVYEIVTAKGVTEVIEHRGYDNYFYVTDDPGVKAELGLSP